MSAFPDVLDHLIVATPDVAATVAEFERRLGVRAIVGGRHPAWGTHNALIGLGDRVYLELMGPDPEAPATHGPRPFGIDRLRAPKLAAWVARGVELDALAALASRHGIDLGGVFDRSRTRPDGSVLSWRMTDPLAPRVDGLLPFFIDWGTTAHPAASAPSGGRVLALSAEHPEPERVRVALDALDLDLVVGKGPAPALIAKLATPRGEVELR